MSFVPSMKRARATDARATQPQRDAAPSTQRGTTAHHTIPAAVVVQRRVLQNKNGWYSDGDPKTFFSTKLEAEKHEASFEMAEGITGGRPATLFTYMATKSHNKMSTRGIPQGPHTVGYSAKLKALHLSKGKIKVRHFVYEQIMDPDAWKEAVIKQLNDDDAFSGDTESSLRLLRAYRDYLAHYAELMRALEGNSKHDAYDLIEEMLQLDPFATYKWWDPKSAKKTHLKYKGENSDLSNPKNIDTNASFKDSQSYKLHLEDVQQMLDFDYIPPDEDDVIDEEEFSDDESESSTTTTNGNATNNGMDIEDEL